MLEPIMQLHAKTDVIYLCGPAGCGKTMMAEALSDYFKNHRRPDVALIDLTLCNFSDKDVERVVNSGLFEIVIVCQGADKPERFPVKPYRVVRFEMGKACESAA